MRQAPPGNASSNSVMPISRPGVENRKERRTAQAPPRHQYSPLEFILSANAEESADAKLQALSLGRGRVVGLLSFAMKEVLRDADFLKLVSQEGTITNARQSQYSKHCPVGIRFQFALITMPVERSWGVIRMKTFGRAEPSGPEPLLRK